MAERRTVLIADGKPGSIPELSSSLRQVGFEVVAVTDALFVQTMALRHRPLAVILGAHLPAGGALTAVMRLRSSVHTASAVVIALVNPGADKQALLSAGVEACLEPPVDADAIVGALQKHLGLSQPVAQAPAAILFDPDRLSALGDTQLLDSEPDEALDIVTRLAAQVIGVPVALVSLVDDKRQFFKSQIGLPAPWDERRQTPLSHSFCQWVVSSQEELVVPDARIHPVLRINRAVAELGVIAYAGVPLSALEGQSIGSFCAIDGEPRPWSDEELATLRDLAQIVDAYTALNAAPGSDLRPGSRERYLRAIARAAGRGFLGAARLLSRDRPPINDQQRREVLRIIERHSHRLTEIGHAILP